jgi:DNA-binding NarL/FixJ family response regulator
MREIRMLIVDDNASFRRRVKELLHVELGGVVVEEAGDGRDAITKARIFKPDLVLMDVRMPGMNGISAARRFANEMPDVKIIVLTTFDLQEYRDAAATCGASGYVIKRSLLEDLIPAVEQSLGIRLQKDRASYALVSAESGLE